jgi:hypothetical protein
MYSRMMRAVAASGIAHLDTHAPVVLRDQQQYAIVDALAANLIRSGDLQGIIFEIIRLRAADHQHHQLRALLFLQRGQLRIELIDLLRRERAGEIGHVARELGHRRLLVVCVRYGPWPQQGYRQDHPKAHPAPHHVSEPMRLGLACRYRNPPLARWKSLSRSPPRNSASPDSRTSWR